MTERRAVRTGKDTILKRAERATPVDAVAELIWNGLDAEANNITVVVSTTEFDAVDRFTVEDNGHGMSYGDAADAFSIDGESWKKQERFSPELQRPLHGQHGRGRFLAYRVAERVQWETVAGDEGDRSLTVITGDRSSPNEFVFDGPAATEKPTGTTVTVRCAQDGAANRLLVETFPRQLRAHLAPSLKALADVVIKYCGDRIDPNEGLEREHELHVNVDGEALHGHDAPRLVVAEWKEEVKYRHVLLCDASGAVITEANLDAVGTPPFDWTAYLLWDGFRDEDLMSVADLHHPEVRHRRLIDAAAAALRSFFADEVDRRRGALVNQWKEEGVYPFLGEAGSPSEAMERELFDVVAVVASPGIGRNKQQKRMSLRLLRESVASSARTREILGAVLDLSEDEKEVLTELLERTTLASMVRAARTVTDRLDFINGLRDLLYSDETRKSFREVDQLQPMVALEPWVFGDEWSDTLVESGLTRLVKSVLERANPNTVFAPEPVRLPDGRSGRVDMVLYRQFPESDAARHLVVELKRANVTLGMKEYGQVADYAATITRHEEVRDLRHRWDFWLVGTDYDTAIEDQFLNSARPGLCIDKADYRLWVVSWPELLRRSEARLEAFRRELDVAASRDQAHDYLQRVHAEYIPTDQSNGHDQERPIA